VNDELRAMTKNQRSFDKPVMMSSEMPSAKYSCSGSPLILVNGKTAIDGRLTFEASVLATPAAPMTEIGAALSTRETR